MSSPQFPGICSVCGGSNVWTFGPNDDVWVRCSDENCLPDSERFTQLELGLTAEIDSVTVDTSVSVSALVEVEDASVGFVEVAEQVRQDLPLFHEGWENG